MKCPMKFADGSRRASQTECERETCAWWVERIGWLGKRVRVTVETMEDER